LYFFNYEIYHHGGPTTTIALNSALSAKTPVMGGRILCLVGGLGLGGLERQLCLLLERLDRDRYQAAVVVWDFREDDPYVARIRDLGIPLEGFPSGMPRVSKMNKFCQIVRQLRPEVVHSYSFHTNFAAFWASIFTGAVAVGSVRSDFTTDLKECGPLLGRLSAYWPRYQIFNNFASAENARCSRTFFLPARSFVVRNGVDLERFRPTPLPDDQPFRITAVGSLLPLKRWDRVLRAALELKRRGLSCLILVAGIGPLKQSLEQQALELGVSDRVKFLGYADHIPRLVSQSRFLIHTSDREGCPNAILEAMACGRAVVATDAGDIPYLVEDGKTGFVVQRGDDTTLVERMAQLIRDRDLCHSMGEAARAKAEREFGLDRLVSETFAVYRAAGASFECVQSAGG
jgi:glycosyltransferase involved in cell wall biosynthesis